MDPSKVITPGQNKKKNKHSSKMFWDERLAYLFINKKIFSIVKDDYPSAAWIVKLPFPPSQRV